MKLAFILDPLDTLLPYKDSSIEMMRAALRRDHEIFAISADSLTLRDGIVYGSARWLSLSDGTPWYQTQEASERPLNYFGAVLMRKDPPFDMEYFYATHLLEIAEHQGARIFNRPRALRDFSEKLSIARFPEWTPVTLVTCQMDTLRAFIRQQTDVILKPLDGMGGRGVFRVRAEDPNVGVILESMTNQGTHTIMAQRYLPAINEGDKRILVVHGEPTPWCLARIPAPGETRGNLAAGGTGHARPLTDRDMEIARHVGTVLREAGILLAGLDVIGDCLTEINVTSPTCMREIRDQTGFDTAEQVIMSLESRVARNGT